MEHDRGDTESDRADRAEPSSRATARRAPRRRVLAGAAAVAAVLLIAVLAAVLFGSHRGQSGVTSGPVTLSPALANKTVYFTASDGVYALRASDGTVRWSYPIPEADGVGSRQVTLAGGVLFVALPKSSRGVPIIALNVTDGTLRSIFWLPNVPAAALTIDSAVIYATADLPLADFGDRPIPDATHVVYALRESDGQEIWRYHAEEPIISRPAVAHGVLYVGTTSAVYALRASDGTFLWRSGIGGGATPEGYAHSSIVSVAITAQTDLVYASYALVRESDDGKSRRMETTLTTLRSNTGEHVLRDGLPQSPGGITQAYPPVVVGNIVYAQGGGGLWATDATPGDTRGWFFNASVDMAGPVLANGTLYTCGWDQYTYAVRASDGHELWRRRLITDPVSPLSILPPAVSDGAVFVAMGAKVFALSAGGGAIAWQYQTSRRQLMNWPVVG